MFLYYLVFLTIVIFGLNFLRHKISREIQVISLLLFRSTGPGVVFYSLFFLPGVIIHELSHLLVASLLGVQTGNISIFPSEIKPGNTKLGYVESAESDPVREGFIGFAPLITGLIIIFVSGGLHFALDPIKQLLVMYLLFSVANTMFVSYEDTRSWWGLLTFLVLAVLFVYVFQLTGFLVKYLPLLNDYLWRLDRILSLLIIIDFCVLSIVFILRRVVQKATGLTVKTSV